MKKNLFDKMKILTSLNYISEVDECYFTKKVLGDEVVGYSLEQQTPYELYIHTDIRKNELTIEFTGKILHDRYPLLISEDTIYECFDNINKMHKCKLATDSIINDSTLLKCDVTKDVTCDNIGLLTEKIGSCITNHKRYACPSYRNNLVISKNVSTSNRKIRLCVYDKEEELKRPENKAFLSLLKDSSRVLDHFEGKARFEMNLNSKRQIREMLHIPDNGLLTVLRSSEQPIFNFLNKILYTSSCRKIDSLRKYEHFLLLESCNFDLIKVESVVRQYASPKTHISQSMKPYIELSKCRWSETGDIKEEILRLLD